MLQYGYGQWEAVKMAIRRSPNFRFDYFLRSLPTELVGRRCEQLMKAAEREVEQLEKKAREEALNKEQELALDSTNSAEGERGGDLNTQSESGLPPFDLPKFKVAQAQKRINAQKEAESERKELESKVEDIEEQMRKIQERLKYLQEYTRENVTTSTLSDEFPDDLIPNLANRIAKSGAAGILSVANAFSSEHPGQVSKKKICLKIDEIASKEKREEEGDTKPMWYVKDDYAHMLDADTLRHVRKAREEKLQKLEERVVDQHEKGNTEVEPRGDETEHDGAVGPDGSFVLFPSFDGTEPPRECKKAFTHFCNATRKKIKASLDPAFRRDKVRRSVVEIFMNRMLLLLTRSSFSLSD